MKGGGGGGVLKTITPNYDQSEWSPTLSLRAENSKPFMFSDPLLKNMQTFTQFLDQMF